MVQTSGEGEGKPSKSQAKRGSHGGDCEADGGSPGGDCEADGAKPVSVKGDRHLEKLCYCGLMYVDTHLCVYVHVCICVQRLVKYIRGKKKERGWGGQEWSCSDLNM